MALQTLIKFLYSLCVPLYLYSMFKLKVKCTLEEARQVAINKFDSKII